MKKMFLLTLLIGAVSVFTACKTRELIPAEVLQIPEHASVFTAYNIWYRDPMKIDSLNILQGQIIPFGTEVEILKATEKEIHFRTVKEDRKFRILYEDRQRMQSPEQYMRTVFTTKTPEELVEGVRPLTYEKIKRGIVEKGMLREEVVLAYGPPAAFRTPRLENDTWIFWTEPLVSRRIIFFDGKVIEIVEL